MCGRREGSALSGRHLPARTLGAQRKLGFGMAISTDICE